MSELKTLATCNPYEFLEQTNRIKVAVEKWLTATDILNIRKRTASLEIVPKDGSQEERLAVFERNKQATANQAWKNLSAMWDAIAVDHPKETVEIMALCCFIEPDDVVNYQTRDLMIAFNSLINDQAVISFFISLASLGQMNTLRASKE